MGDPTRATARDAELTQAVTSLLAEARDVAPLTDAERARVLMRLRSQRPAGVPRRISRLVAVIAGLIVITAGISAGVAGWTFLLNRQPKPGTFDHEHPRRRSDRPKAPKPTPSPPAPGVQAASSPPAFPEEKREMHAMARTRPHGQMAKTPAHPASVPATATHETEPAPIATDDLDGDVAEFAAAVAALRAKRAPNEALALLDRYIASRPEGRFGEEARILRAEALLGAGRREDAARAFAGLRPGLDRRGRELLVLRGELRFGLGEHGRALEDFHAVVATGDATNLGERALYGYAVTLLRIGRTHEAQAAFIDYLNRWPQGSFAPTAREHTKADQGLK